MKTAAPPLELHALEKLREEELEEARAIQSVMLPAESLRAGAVMISHEFQPVAAVSGFTWAMFQGKDYQRRCMRHWRWNVARRAQDGHFAACPCDFEPAADDSQHAPAVHGHPVCGFQPAQPRTANCQRGHARAISSLRQRLPQPETLGDPPGLIRRGKLRDADLRLLAGDSVLSCSDVHSDAFSRKEEQFGIERLQEL